VRLGVWLGLWAILALGGCSAAPARLTACKAAADDNSKLQAKLATCAAAIRQGARGDDLETALAQSGDAQRQLSKPDLAIQDFNRALRLKANDDFALDGRGVAYLDAGKPQQLALADFNAAIRANPGNGDAFDHRGYLERYNGDFNAAIVDESRAIELEPQAALPWANRGYAYAGKRWWDFAIADFTDALRLASNYVFALQGRAEAERGKGDAKAAVRDYGDVVADDPHGDDALDDAQAMVDLSPAGDPEALNSRCWARGVLGAELPAALADCQQSLAVRPNSAETLDSLAMVYFRQGRFPEAVDQYSAALAADPKQNASLFMRGVAKLRAGDKDGGEADIAAAEAVDKSVASRFAGYGIAP
jgi:tetratricopeptide (TPR) repeat protein